MEWDLDERFQYGYAHETNVNVWGQFAPIEDRRGQRWYPSREAAAAAMRNDLRWYPELFIIRREVPAAPERIS